MKSLISKLISKGIIEYGDFTLKSGKKSNIYCDFKKVISYPRLKKDICTELGNMIEDKTNIVIGGVPIGAISFAGCISDLFDIPMIVIREEKKTYGMKNLIDGDILEREVVLVEDVVTTGGSVIKILKALEQENIKVREIITIMDREESGVETIRKLGYKISSLLKLSEINPKKYINPLINRIRKIIREKNTNIILSADEDNPEKVIDLIEKTGPFLLGVKLHKDIFDPQDLPGFIDQIKRLKKKYNLIIIEDRKYADIGSIVLKQVNRIKEWADIITAYGITGESMITALNQTSIGVLLIHSLSTVDNLIDKRYSDAVKDMAIVNNNVIGFITQNKVLHNYLHFSPGVRLDAKKDTMGQRYNTPKIMKSRGTDIFIIGRGIYQAKDPVEATKLYRLACVN